MSKITLESQLFEIINDKEMPEHIKLAKIDMLVRLGVDVNAMYGAKSALMLANEVKEEKIAKFLEENGAKEFFDEEIAKELGKKLIEVCANGEKKDVEELIDMGADINQKNKYGNTALMRASYWGNKEVVELLIEKGADVNQKDNNAKPVYNYEQIVYEAFKDSVSMYQTNKEKIEELETLLKTTNEKINNVKRLVI